MTDLEAVGEVLEDNAVDELLQQCSEISVKLRNALGSAKGTGSWVPLLFQYSKRHLAIWLNNLRLRACQF